MWPASPTQYSACSRTAARAPAVGAFAASRRAASATSAARGAVSENHRFSSARDLFPVFAWLRVIWAETTAPLSASEDPFGLALKRASSSARLLEAYC